MIVSVALFFALVAWTYLASCFVEDSFYNAYVNRLRSAMFRPVTAVQRAVPRLSERAAAALVFALAVAVVAALSRVGASSAVPGGAPAGAAFGGGLRVLPARPGADAALALAAGRFAILLGQLALLRLLLVWRLGGGDGSGVLAFLDTAAWPLSLPRGLSQTAAAACAALFGGTALCVFAFSPAAVAAARSSTAVRFIARYYTIKRRENDDVRSQAEASVGVARDRAPVAHHPENGDPRVAAEPVEAGGEERAPGVGAKNEQRRRKPVGPHRRRRQDRHGGDAVGNRRAGAPVVYVSPAEIRGARGERLALMQLDRRRAGGPIRILHADAPTPLRRLQVAP